jgi:L-lactate utilization protein LutB
MSVIDQAKNAAAFIEDKTHEVSFDKLIWMLRQKRDEAALQVLPLITEAKAGMTGANFAIAETGAIVTVTNEGNADLSGNVPKLRICSVGIEKIIPNNEQLAVFIRLLTRSATGMPGPEERR